MFNFDLLDMKIVQGVKSGPAESALFDKIPSILTGSTVVSPPVSTKPVSAVKDAKDAKNTGAEKILMPEMI